MNKELSEKLRLASLIATILVVLRHAANWVAFFPKENAPQWLLRIEWGTLFMTDVAVPFFFILSGFLFMRVDYIAEGTYASMLKKKAKTLLFPFVVWNLVGGCILLYYDSEGNLGNTWSSCLTNFVTSHWYGPLWYVRDIMFLMFLFPFYGWMYKNRFQWVLVFLIPVLMCYRWSPCETNVFSGEGIVFFLLGGFIQKHSFMLEKKMEVWFSAVVCLFWIYISFEYTSWSMWIHRGSIMLGLVSFWFVLDLVPKGWKSVLLKLSPYTFLIYVTHFYLHKVFKVGLAYFFPENAIVALIAFFVVPIVTIAVIIVVGKFWKQRFPTFYSICVGGRG